MYAYPLSAYKHHPRLIVLKFSDTAIEQVSKFKFLGCVVNYHLSWDDHIQLITTKVIRNIFYVIFHGFYPEVLFWNSEAYILLSFDYCDVVRFCCTRTQALKLERLQNYAGRMILKEPHISSPIQASIHKKLRWTALEARRNTHMVTHIFKTLKNMTPTYLQSLL